MTKNVRNLGVVALVLGLCLAALPAAAQNSPAASAPLGPTASGAFFNNLSGVTDLTSTNTVNYTFTVTGTANDGAGDSVTLQIWDDGTMKTSKSHNVAVGVTQTITDSVTWTGPIGTAAACIGVVLVDSPGTSALASVDPFCLTGEFPLSVAKTAPASVAVGGQLTYTITYGNTTISAINGVVITDTVPSGTTFVSATNGGTFSGGVVTWNVGTVPASTTGLTVSFTVLVTATGGQVNNSTYSITGTGVAPLAGAPVRTTVTAAPVAAAEVPVLGLPAMALLGALIAAVGVLFLARGRAGA